MDTSGCYHSETERSRRSLTWVLLFIAITLTACPLVPSPSAPPLPDPISGTTVILFIGDGMGSQQILATEAAQGERLSFTGFPVRAQVLTSSLSSSVTDSAAAATAMATGMRVANGVISMSPEGVPYETLVTSSQNLGKPTGIVTTTELTHATPAAFGAHAASRNDKAVIADGLINQSRPSILFGGGGAGLTSSMITEAGYLLAESADQLTGFTLEGVRVGETAAAPRFAGLFGTTHLPYVLEGRGDLPSLTAMTMKAISLLTDLDTTDAGFFLMVEAGRIDHAAHANDLPSMIAEVWELSEAVQAVLDWADGRDNVIIVVTADHETGGLTQTAGTGEFFFTTTGHTAAEVPLYASGSGESLFSHETMSNTWIHAIISGYYH